jgi:multidrug efflux pump
MHEPEKFKNKYEQIREFALSTLSIDNRTTVFVLSIIIAIMGIIAYRSMPKATFPDLVVPKIYIGTPYPGNSPVDVEKLITRPLEKELKSITGIDKITSTSLQGYSTIIAEFNFDVSPTDALRKVKDAVDKAKSNKKIPDDLPSDPNVFEMNFSEFPILNINLSGDFSIDQLKEYAEYLEDEIEQLPGVSKVDIRGVQEKEMKVEVDVNKMEALQISFDDIENAIRSENVMVAGGDILTDSYRRTVRVLGEFTSANELKNVIVKREKLNIVYLREIADVTFGFAERNSYAREFGKPVVMLDVVKRSGANLIITSEEINNIIYKAKQDVLPEDLQLSITNDQSDMTRSQVDNLENSIISGVILVVLVLLFFMGLRSAVFVGIAIPMSMFLSFMILGAMGVTMNLMVLFSLILALGMLVDNGIVVVENIYRLSEEGVPLLTAAKKGVGEVALPIISSTATTLAAFIPLAFWPGMMGEFMKFLPITLMIVLGSSLFVGLVVTPVLTATYMKPGEIMPDKRRATKSALYFILPGIVLLLIKFNSLGNLLIVIGLLILVNARFLAPWADKFQKIIIPKMEAVYYNFLSFSLSGKKPILFLSGTIGLLIFSFILLGMFTPRVEFFPVNEPKYVNIFIEKPIGADIEATNKVALKVEEAVSKVLSKYNETTIINNVTQEKNYLIESFIAQVGEGTSDPSRGPVMGNTPHKARVQVSFVDFQNRRGISTQDVLEEIRAAVRHKIPGAKIVSEKDQNGPPRGKPITIEVIGDDYDSLIVYAENIRRFVNENNVPGVEELSLDIELGKPELLVNIDRAKARRFNLSTGQIATALRTSVFGKEVSKYKQGEDDFPINIRMKESMRNNEEALLNQRITFRDPSNGKISQVPVSSVASAVKSSTFSAVNRKNLNRVVTVSSNVLSGYNPTQTVAQIKEVLKNYELPKGYQIKFTGEQEDQAKEMAFLSKALIIAVFLIFLIIVAQFNSSATPFLITASVVFSLIGVLLGLVIFQMDFIVIMTMIGIISLAGVVVNNAIVLIDYTNLLIERKKKELGVDEKSMLPIEEIAGCIIQGGKTRLRPVLLTAITTVLGMLPLATGMNINFFTLFSDYNPQIFFGGDNVIFWGPIAWTVIFGLSFATFLTLVIVPVMYLILNRIKHKIWAKKTAST